MYSMLCKRVRTKFVTNTRDNMLEPRLGKITKWGAQHPEEHGRECEIGEAIYFPEAGLEPLWIVCLRAEKIGLQSVPHFDEARCRICSNGKS